MSTIEERTTEPAPGLQAQQTKEEFMIACKADGTDEVTCENRWNAAHQVNTEVTPQPTAPGDTAGLTREIEMLRSRLQVREKQLVQAIGIANRANDARKAKDNAEKQRIITSIQMDSHFTKDELKTKTLKDLQTMRWTLDKSIEQNFASVAAEIDAQNRKTKPQLTAGYYDPVTKTWKGGM